jgi:hypothetical protein
MTQMVNVSEKAARLMKSRPGSFFVFGSNEDVPVETCAKFGVKLFVDKVKGQPFKIVKRV